MAQVVQNNQQLTEGLAQQQEQMRIQSAKCKHSHRWLSRLPTEAEVLSTPHRSGNQTGILRGTQEQVLTEWQAWSYMLLTWFSSQFTKGAYALDWAKNQVIHIGNDETTVESTHGGWTDLARINAQLQIALVSFLS